jgi:hypothetical protein
MAQYYSKEKPTVIAKADINGHEVLMNFYYKATKHDVEKAGQWVKQLEDKLRSEADDSN